MKHWKPSLRHPDHRGDAVQLVFTNAGLSPQTLLRRYPKINELGAFIANQTDVILRAFHFKIF